VVAAPTHTWDLLFGVTATSQYISRGIAQSTGAAIQPWAELDVNSFYLGYWGSNVSPSLLSGAHFENDLSVGWRPTHGPLTFDFGYVRYVYDVSSIDYGEVYGKVSVNPVQPLTWVPRSSTIPMRRPPTLKATPRSLCTAASRSRARSARRTARCRGTPALHGSRTTG
jgi:hypothetical protein